MATTKTPDANFSEEFFNDIFFDIHKALYNEDLRYIYIYGGSSASKTYSVVQASLLYMLSKSDGNIICFRKYGSDIRDSIYADFKLAAENLQIAHLFTFQINYIKCVTGSYVRFRGLDDSEKVKGLAGFDKVILEEITQFELADHKQIRKRLRGRKFQQLIGLFNPIDEGHWIKQDVFDHEVLIDLPCKYTSCKINDTGNMLVMKVTYLDNKYIVGPYNLDKHVIADFEKDKVTDANYYSIYALGNFGKLRKGGEFFYRFMREFHVKDAIRTNGRSSIYDPNKPLYLVMDKNNLPYITGHLYQLNTIGKETTITQVDEVCVQYLPKWAEEFKRRYPSALVHELYISGDATAKSEDGLTEEGDNMYRRLQVLLKDYRPSLRLPSVNPSVKDTKDFFNDILYLNAQSLGFEIASICNNSIYDYSYALEDEKGGVVKSVIRDKATKKSYQEYGHHCDVMRYFLNTFFNREFKQWLNGGVESRGTAGRISKTQLRY